MSQLFKTNLEEYARQCTLQRRRYEECLQQVQQSDTVDTSAMSTAANTQPTVGQSSEDRRLNPYVEQTAPNGMIDLLEMPTELLGWDDEASISNNVHHARTKRPQWQDDRPPATQRNVVNPTIKSVSPVGYGAP